MQEYPDLILENAQEFLEDKQQRNLSGKQQYNCGRSSWTKSVVYEHWYLETGRLGRNNGDLNDVAKYEGNISSEWRKDKSPLKEYTGYIVAGHVTAGTLLLLDQQTYQHTYLKSKSSQ